MFKSTLIINNLYDDVSETSHAEFVNILMLTYVNLPVLNKFCLLVNIIKTGLFLYT